MEKVQPTSTMYINCVLIVKLMFFAIIYLATYLTKTCLWRLIFATKRMLIISKNKNTLIKRYATKNIWNSKVYESLSKINCRLNIWCFIVYCISSYSTFLWTFAVWFLLTPNPVLYFIELPRASLWFGRLVLKPCFPQTYTALSSELSSISLGTP